MSSFVGKIGLYGCNSFSNLILIADMYIEIRVNINSGRVFEQGINLAN